MSMFTTLKRAVVRRPQLKRRIKQARYLGLQALCHSLGPGIDPRVRILGYHAVGDGENDLSVSAAEFRRQLEWLMQHGYRLMTMSQWHEAMTTGQPLASRTVILTFDDGFRSVLTHAAPILAEYGAATVFVLTDYVGRTNSFDRPFQAPELPLLSWDQIERLKRLGWDIQSHGRRHYPMFRLQPSVLEDEAAGSKALLEQRLGEPVRFLCYPYGAFEPASMETARRAGYVGAVTCRSGVLPSSRSAVDAKHDRETGRGMGRQVKSDSNLPSPLAPRSQPRRSEDDWFRLPRSLVDGLMSLGDFAAMFTPAYLRATALDARWQQWRGRESVCRFESLDTLRHLGVFDEEPALAG